MANQIPDKYIDIAFDLYPEYKTGKEQTLDPNDSLWWRKDWNEGQDGRYIIPKLLFGSDYSGTLVEKSNAQAFAEQFKDGQGIWWQWVYGGHGTYGIVIDRQAIPEEEDPEEPDTLDAVLECLESLTDYPLLDDDLHTNMEIEAQDEAWNDWARGDFQKVIKQRIRREEEARKLDEEGESVDVDEIEGDFDAALLFEVFCAVSDRIGEYWTNEQGDQMYIRVEKLADRLTPEELKQLIASIKTE